MLATKEVALTKTRTTESKSYPFISIPILTFCDLLTNSAIEKGLPISEIQVVHPDSPLINGFEEEGIMITWTEAPDRKLLEGLDLYIDCSRKLGWATIFEVLDAGSFLDFLLNEKLVDWSFKWFRNKKGGTVILSFQD